MDYRGEYTLVLDFFFRLASLFLLIFLCIITGELN